MSIENSSLEFASETQKFKTIVKDMNFRRMPSEIGEVLQSTDK